MKPRHLEKTDTGYKVYLYIFYICGAIMASTLIFGVYATMLEWLANGTYVMGEVIHNTTIPFENFARVSTWIFFSTIIGWYCVTRIGWRRTAGNKIIGTRMALLQLMLLGFTIISFYEVLYEDNGDQLLKRYDVKYKAGSVSRLNGSVGKPTVSLALTLTAFIFLENSIYLYNYIG